MGIAADSKVGPYTVLGRLGAGGMGEVWRACDPRLGREVAIKVLPEGFCQDAERLRRFEKEVRATGALNHPNILAVFDVGTHEGAPYYVGELLEGETLRERLEKGPLPVRKALEIAVEVARGLAAAHEKCFVHRDLKPENLFLTKDGRTKILDFGLAKNTCDVPRPDDTASEAVVGSAGYMAPEQVRGRSADERSDLFAFGAVLYEMLAGKRAFPGETAVERGYAILSHEPPPFPNPVPAAVERIVRRCLEKAPEARFRSAHDLAYALEALAESPSGPVAPQSGPPARKKKGALLALGAVIAVGAGAWGGSQWTRGAGSPQAASASSMRSFTRLTSEPGEEQGPQISPDGTWVVYGAKVNDVGHVFRQRVGGTTRTDLTPGATEHAWQPAISPDGERVAFRSERDGGGIFVMGSTGESVRRVTDFGYYPAWSPDGAHLLLSSAWTDNPADRGELSEAWIVDVESGEKQRVEAGPDAYQGAWSPHDQRLAFSGVVGAGWQRVIFTVPRTGGAPRILLDAAGRSIWSPTWSPDGRFVYFSSSLSGVFNIERVEVDEATGERKGEPESLTRGVGAALYYPSLSRDGRKLVFASHVVSSNLERVPLDERGRTAGAPSAVTRGNAHHFVSEDVSPDGEHLAFASSWGRPDVEENIYIARADGSDLRALTNDVAKKNRRPRWTSDGKTIVFYSNRSGTYQLWSVSPDGSGLRMLGNLPGEKLAQFPVPSRGDRRASMKVAEKTFIFDTLLTIAEQTPTPIADCHCEQECEFWPTDWSPDGKFLAGHLWMKSGSSASFIPGLGVYSFESQACERLAAGSSPRWLPDGSGLVFVDADWHGLSRYDLERKEVTPLFSLGHDGLESCSVSRDGRWLYFDRSVQDGDVWLMDLPAEGPP